MLVGYNQSKAHALVRRGTTPASTAHTLNSLILLQLHFRYPADAGRAEVRLFSLDARQATKLMTC